MHSRFNIDDISSFPYSEQERGPADMVQGSEGSVHACGQGIREAFYRFKSIGSSDIDVDNLEKVLSHLGYLKIDLQAG